MNAIHYIGFDVHKKTISFCVKTAAGLIVEEGTLEAERTVLRCWAAARKRAWRGAMEATLLSPRNSHHETSPKFPKTLICVPGRL